MGVEVSARGPDTDTLLTHPHQKGPGCLAPGGLRRLRVQKADGQVGPWETRDLAWVSHPSSQALGPKAPVPKTGSCITLVPLGVLGWQAYAGQSWPKAPQNPSANGLR